ncbi:sigma-54 dependent transcriptional regulator [Fusibacter sp. 3D3]|uniref:sigma-54-dependent transcriptional regulator n=1 Tax=Fusibacter sp. 3D3 TaxID=1048380 RepID=UPI0008532D66|nr:sigma-54 dependent transcriptional regulator [Fusibacter sp. 3D3]GAU79263.1 response regulator of zinc sigma-54-dependent two-component system [Fusibacter sp. 3D3]
MESTKILIVDDEIEYRETYRMLLEDNGYIVGEASGTEEALEILEREYYPVVLTDILMTGEDGIYLLKQIKKRYQNSIEVIIVTGYGSVTGAVEAMRIGALGYFIKSHNPQALLVEIHKAKRLVQFEAQKNTIRKKTDAGAYISQSQNPQMQKILDTIDELKTSNCNVLLTGESGVGKEIIAKWIHEKSSRVDEILLPVNCQAMSENLLESELFGHEKGAFTGAANKRIGRFEESHGGTLFLDEIGELSPEIQVKLLRVLDNRYIERLGSNKQIPVNFRLISATNRDLATEIKKGNFRQDLFYRINTLHIEIPPLRDRREDLQEMITFFINQYSIEMKKEIKVIDQETEKYLLTYDYPGNIRELKNIIERLVVLSKAGVLKMDFMPQQGILNNQTYNQPIMLYKEAKKIFEINFIMNALSNCNNNITKTAEAIGMSRKQLFNKMVEHDLNRD